MAAKRQPKLGKAATKKAAPVHDVKDVVRALKKRASKQTKDGMARYGIPSDKAFGVPVGVIRLLGKSLGHSHALAAALWKTGHYEARMLATFVDEAALVPRLDRNRRATRGPGRSGTALGRQRRATRATEPRCAKTLGKTPKNQVIAAWSKSPRSILGHVAFATAPIQGVRYGSADFRTGQPALRQDSK